MDERRERAGRNSLHGPAMVDVDIALLGGSPTELLDAVQRNVDHATALFGQLTGAGFGCGCYATLAYDGRPQSHWRIMAWDDSRCGLAAHRALRAKWEGGNLA